MIWLILASLASFALALWTPSSTRGDVVWSFCCIVYFVMAFWFAMNLTAV